MPKFDPTVINRKPSLEDLGESGSVHMMVWGRQWNAAQIEHLGKLFDADYFLVGHTPQEMGYATMLKRVLILASDHSHGVFLPFAADPALSRGSCQNETSDRDRIALLCQRERASLTDLDVWLKLC